MNVPACKRRHDLHVQCARIRSHGYFVPSGGCAQHVARLAPYSGLERCKDAPMAGAKGVSKAWIRSLPAGDYLHIADVVDLVAFGPAKMAIGLSDIDEHAAQLRAGIAIINAAIESRIKLVGTPCERLQTHPHLLRQTGHRIVIESETLHDLIPVPFGGRDWLGPRRYANEYAETGGQRITPSAEDASANFTSSRS